MALLPRITLAAFGLAANKTCWACNPSAWAAALGLNNYERVTKTDFKPTYDYWEKNKAYWAEVRAAWDNAFQQNEVLGLKFTRQKGDDKKAHYMQFMKQAKEFAGKNATKQQMDENVKTILNQ